MPSTRDPLPERAPTARVEGRTIALRRCPHLWLGGVAAAIGLGVWAYDRHWQSGVLAGLGACWLLAVIYMVLAWMFGWPQVRWIDAVDAVFDLLNFILSLLSVLS